MNNLNRYIKIFLTIFFSIFFTTAFAANPPLQVSTHTYTVYLNDKKVGEVTQTLSLKGDDYIFNSTSRTAVLFYHNTENEESSGRVIASQFEFSHYQKSDQHSKNTVTMNADWIHPSVQLTDAQGTRTSKFIPPMYDHLNYQLQLARDAMSHLKQFYYSVLTENGLQKLTFDRLGPETLMVGKKPVTAVKFCDQEDENGLQLCLWYEGLTLVQSAQIKNGKMVERAVLEG